MTNQQQAAELGSKFDRARWVPLFWSGAAALAMLGFATLLAPRLPASFLVWFNADRASPGDMYYRLTTDDSVVAGWLLVAIFSIAALICVFFAGRGIGWALFLGLGVSVTAPLLVGLLYGSVLWQLGLPSPAQEIPPAVGAFALIAGFAGLASGLFSFFGAFGRRG